MFNDALMEIKYYLLTYLSFKAKDLGIKAEDLGIKAKDLRVQGQRLENRSLKTGKDQGQGHITASYRI